MTMNKGFALITVLAVAIMIALTAATVLQSLSSYGSMKVTAFQEVKAAYLAEAASQHALYRCRTNTLGCGGGPNPCCVAETINLNSNPLGVAVNTPATITTINSGSGTTLVTATVAYQEIY
jgi:type II secretory pathway pseudopilin PulG